MNKLLRTIKENDGGFSKYCGKDNIPIYNHHKRYLKQSRIKELEALVEIAEKMNNFRNAKIDGKEDWNNDLPPLTRSNF